ncbi:MAG: hypothetical protein R3A13_01505 [Bdellovibrionota bacterium]
MGPDLMKEMEDQAARFGTEYLQEIVEEVDLSNRPFTLKTSAKTLTCDVLLIATGAQDFCGSGC